MGLLDVQALTSVDDSAMPSEWTDDFLQVRVLSLR